MGGFGYAQREGEFDRASIVLAVRSWLANLVFSKPHTGD